MADSQISLQIFLGVQLTLNDQCPDCKVHEANMGPTWGWQGPGGPHVGPMSLAIRVVQVLACSWTGNILLPELVLTKVSDAI